MKLVLDACRLNEREKAHGYLKEKLNFPDYYGCNLDALYDCLTEMDANELEEVIFENQEDGGEYFRMVYRVFEAAGYIA